MLAASAHMTFTLSGAPPQEALHQSHRRKFSSCGGMHKPSALMSTAPCTCLIRVFSIPVSYLHCCIHIIQIIHCMHVVYISIIAVIHSFIIHMHSYPHISALHCTLPYRCEDESIDEIAAFLGVGEQVAALTARYASCVYVPVVYVCQWCVCASGVYVQTHAYIPILMHSHTHVCMHFPSPTPPPPPHTAPWGGVSNFKMPSLPDSTSCTPHANKLTISSQHTHPRSPRAYPSS